MTMGERLRLWRDKAGLSQEQAAKLVGVVQGTWKAWEAGSTPEADYIEAIEKLTRGTIVFKGWARDRRRRREAAKATAPESGTDIVSGSKRAG